MPKAMQNTIVRPLWSEGSWETVNRTLRTRAHRLLGELRDLCQQIQSTWPNEVGKDITDQAQYPELWDLCERRDALSDFVRVTAAMSVEGFLNFYGVFRLGHEVFDDYYERLGLVPKLRGLFLICDQLNIPKQHALVSHLDRLAQSRNQLVHPKAREASGAQSPPALGIPDEAEAMVEAMESFFSEFAAAVPDAAFLLKRSDS